MKKTILTPDQWRLYDTFCSKGSLSLLAKWTKNGEPWPLLTQIRRMAEELHRSLAIHTIERPERAGWTHPKAWLCLNNTSVFNFDRRYVAHYMRTCDVLIPNQWDRDVFATHTPINEIVSGYMLSGTHEEMVGLFLPLFDKETVVSAIQIRRDEDNIQQETWITDTFKGWNQVI